MLNRCTFAHVIVFIRSRGVDEDHVWAVLEEQGRMVKWLARVTDIPAKRLYDIRHRRSRWCDAEAEAISRALGVPRERRGEYRRDDRRGNAGRLNPASAGCGQVVDRRDVAADDGDVAQRPVDDVDEGVGDGRARVMQRLVQTLQHAGDDRPTRRPHTYRGEILT
jgi:hypothetical protein